MKHLSRAGTRCVTEIRHASKIWPLFVPVGLGPKMRLIGLGLKLTQAVFTLKNVLVFELQSIWIIDCNLAIWLIE
jgi:hypothetical protein